MIKPTTITQLRARVLGLVVVARTTNPELTPPRLELRSSASQRVVRVAKRRFRPDTLVVNEEWPADPVELFRFLEGGSGAHHQKRR